MGDNIFVFLTLFPKAIEAATEKQLPFFYDNKLLSYGIFNFMNLQSFLALKISILESKDDENS